jgi:Ran GTPase-activating protein (RanGAP) involved in mRNA processing and transport
MALPTHSIMVSGSPSNIDPVTIIEALPNDTSITSLSFSGQYLGEAAATRIAMALTTNQTLTELTLTNAHIGRGSSIGQSNIIEIKSRSQ